MGTKLGATRVLLTGGGGMVGRNILESEEAANWEFLIPSSHELDLRDYHAVETYVRRERPEVVIHAAGRVGGIQANMAHPVDFLVTNLDVGRNIIMAARAVGVKRLLNLASSCIYPRNAENPLCEERILQGELEPSNEGYALAKIVSTRLCQYINRENPLFQYKTLIPCNLYGRHDNFAPENSHLIAAIIHKIHFAKVKSLDTVDIWGDGTARREFMYSGDMADAVMFAINHFDALPELMNVGVGCDHTVNEYYEAVIEVIGWRGNLRHDLAKPVGMRQKLVSVTRQTHLGWVPSTPLLEGLTKTYQYYLEQHRQ